jgi:hypothetical protein
METEIDNYLHLLLEVYICNTINTMHLLKIVKVTSNS